MSSTEIESPILNDKSDDTTMYINFKAGYMFDMGLYVGAVYDMYNSASGDGGEDKSTRGGYGASLGYMSEGGFSIFFSYLLAADGTYKSGSTDWKFTGGSGMIFDIGYGFEINSNFRLGPVLSYRSYTFTTLDNNGTEVDIDKWTETEIFPMVGLFFNF
jgi:hypothetical protein